MTTKVCKKCNKEKQASDFPTDNSAKDKLWRFCRYCEYVRKHPDNPMTEKAWLAKKNAPKAPKKTTKKTTKPTKKAGKKKSLKGETTEDLQKRIDNMSPTSTGLNIKTVTPQIKKWAEQEGYGWEDEHTLYIGAKAT